MQFATSDYCEFDKIHISAHQTVRVPMYNDFWEIEASAVWFHCEEHIW